MNFFIYDSEQELSIDFNMSNFYLGEFTRFSFLFGKNFPAFNNNVTFSLGVGTVKIFRAAYSGQLQSRINEDWALIFRPNMKFTF